MDARSFLYKQFIKRFPYEPTPCQERLFTELADFLYGGEGDIMVVNGYAGTGKTSALAAVVAAFGKMGTSCVLLAPTGRAAKVLSSYTKCPAYTIHKHIYRQKSFDDGIGKFTLAPNKERDVVYIVDEVSLIGIEQGRSNVNFGSGNLLEDLINFVRSGIDCKLVMVGDGAQLPPVGLDRSPALSPEYMSIAGGVRFCTLSSVVRQASKSGILHNATILRGYITEGVDGLPFSKLGLEIDGFEDVSRVSGGELIETLSDAYDKYGEDGTVVLCRSNKRANRYNAGIRAQVQYREERLVKGDKLMIVKNCYQFDGRLKGTDYIANGDIARLEKVSNYEDRYGLHFAQALLSLPDYDGQEIKAKICLDTLLSEAASLSSEQQNALYQGVLADYAHLRTKKQMHDAVREDPYYNALQIKYAQAITCHKSQGGQWNCVFVDNSFWQGEFSLDDLKWLYTAFTRAVDKLYLVNFKNEYFIK